MSIVADINFEFLSDLNCDMDSFEYPSQKFIELKIIYNMINTNNIICSTVFIF